MRLSRAMSNQRHRASFRRSPGVLAVALFVVTPVGVGAQSAAPGGSPSMTPEAGPPALMPIGELESGMTYLMDDGCCVGPSPLLFTVPGAGWFSIDSIILGKKSPGSAAFYDLAFMPGIPEDGTLTADPCHWSAGAVDPPVGPTVDDLAAALVDQGGPGTAAATEVTLGGHRGKRVELPMPAALDPGTCDGGEFHRWQFPDGSVAGFVYGQGQHDVVYIIDVDGTRQVLDAIHLPGAAAADLAELDALVASISFAPVAPSVAPTT